MMQTPCFLVADVGGTNTRVALARGHHVVSESVTRFRNDDFTALEPVLARYLTANGAPEVAGVCVDVAGPVAGDTARLTNRDWQFSCAALCAATGASRAALLNDMQAQGHALPVLGPDDVETLRPGTPARDPNAARLVVNVGTGFNIAPVYQGAQGTIVPPSEAGHAPLVVRSPEDLSLMQFLEEKHGFAAVEDVLSGRGLLHAWSWIAPDLAVPEASDIMAQVAQDAVARRCVEVLARQLGHVCGTYALEFLPFGGIFLVGGVARALAPWLDQSFWEPFGEKGRFSSFVSGIPLHVVTDDYAGLRGCAAHIEALMAGKISCE